MTRSQLFCASTLLIVSGCVVQSGTPAATTTPTTGPTTVTPSGGGSAGPGGLTIGGSASNFGSFRVTPGFLPDPQSVGVVSGGDLDVRALGLGPGCVGWATRQPDYIMMLDGSSGSLRVYAVSTGGDDTTLIINAADGSWHCNDDSYGGTNPSVDLPGAGPGQYDIWVGSYRQGVQAHANLYVTEIGSNHP